MKTQDLLTAISTKSILYLSVLLFPIAAISGLSISLFFTLLALFAILQNYKQTNFLTVANNHTLWIFPLIIAIFCYLAPQDVLPIKLGTRIVAMYFLGIMLVSSLRNKSFNYHTLFLYISYSYMFAISMLFIAQIIDPQTLEIFGKKFYKEDFDANDFLTLKINRQLCVFSLLYILITRFLYIHQKKPLAATTYLLTLITIFISNSETAKFVFIITNLMFLTIFFLKQKYRYIFITSYFLGNLIAIIIIPNINIQNIAETTNLQYSAVHRLCIWKYTIDQIKQNPFGYGFNSSTNFFYTNKRDKEICVQPNNKTNTVKQVIKYHISWHPHYNILQILLELGLAGLFLLGLLLIKTEKFLQRHCKNRVSIAISYSTLFGYLAIGTTGYDIWQSWYFSSLFLVAFYNLILIKNINQTAQRIKSKV